MARLLALCSLPRTNPGDRHQYKRVNGPYKLILSRTGDYKLPFGNLPRLLLAWVCTEAVTDPKPRAGPGSKSLSEFMRTLGIRQRQWRTSRGELHTAPQPDKTALPLQHFAELRRMSEGMRSVSSFIADKHGVLVERAQARRAFSLWESKIELGEKFFNEIIQHPVPIDMNTLKALKRCSLGLDLYLWLSLPDLRASCSATAHLVAVVPPIRRGHRHQTPAASAPSKTSGRKVLRELKKIKLAWPGLNYTTAPRPPDRACLRSRPLRRSDQASTQQANPPVSGPSAAFLQSRWQRLRYTFGSRERRSLGHRKRSPPQELSTGTCVICASFPRLKTPTPSPNGALSPENAYPLPAIDSA